MQQNPAKPAFPKSGHTHPPTHSMMNSPTPTSPNKEMPTLPQSPNGEPWLDDMFVAVDVDQMTKTLSTIKAKNIRPDLLSPIISHYASKWLPDVLSSPATSTAVWLKKRSFVETLTGLLPLEKDALPCDFLLRLLRAACMVGAGRTCLEELETRVAYQLDKASLKELTIPAFSHTCGTLLDFGLVLRLVRKFVASDEAARSGAATAKVAKLVDSYLAEAAADAGLAVSDFEELATALPGHVRANDDGLYRAVDTYIKAHPGITKQEKKAICRLIDTRKLTPEASLHAVHNDRLPVRSVIQVIFSEQSKLSRGTNDWGNVSFSGPRSPNLAFELPGRCQSKREVLAQQQEMRKLREDVVRLQAQCRALQAQVDGLIPADKKKKGLFKWSGLLFWSTDSVDKAVDDYESVIERRRPLTPMDVRKSRRFQAKDMPRKWRNSMS